MNEARVSWFASITKQIPDEDVPLDTVIADIRGPAHARTIAPLRRLYQEGKEEEYRKGKNALPAFSPAATMTTREAGGVITPSGLLYYDCDKIEAPQLIEARKQLQQNPSVAFIFLSPSGVGLKIGLAVEGLTPESYHDAWAYYRDMVEEAGIAADSAVSSIKSMCFLSSDAQAYYNGEAEPLPLHRVERKPPKPVPRRVVEQPEEEDRRIQDALEAIPATDYHTWIRVGMALKHVKGNGWFDVWDAWSSRAANYNERGMYAKWKSFTERTADGGGVGLGTIYKYAKDHGWRDLRKEKPRPMPQMYARDTGDKGEEGDSEGSRDPLDAFHYYEKDPEKLQRNIHNLTRILLLELAHKGVLGYNRLEGKEVFLQCPPWSPEKQQGWKPKEIEDVDYIGCNSWVSTIYGINFPPSWFGPCLDNVARFYTFHPIEDYLQSLQWDGVPRIETWLTRYCMADDTEYTRAVGRSILVSAVARALDPGCQVDTMVIFEGAQGVGKSSVLRILGGDWYSESMLDLHSKDAMQSLCGKWIIELSELASIRRSEVEAVKRFISARDDHYRPAYGRKAITYKRSCIFVGTTNLDQYLQDSTGNRRFFPIHINGSIATNTLQEVRDQLWAEAVVAYHRGDSWIVQPALRETVVCEQEQRVEEDSWMPILEGKLPKDRAFTSAEILIDFIEMEASKQKPEDSRRLGRVMRQLGWEMVPIRQRRIDDGKPYLKKQWRMKKLP